MSAAQADETAEALLARVAEARRRLADAAATADLPGVAAALDELEDVHTLAREAGVPIPRAGQAPEFQGRQAAEGAEHEGKKR